MALTPPRSKKTLKIHTTPSQRNRVYTLLKLGCTSSEVGRLEGLTPSTCRGIANRFEKQKSGRTSTKTGRPKLIDDRDRRAILRTIKADPFISLRDLSEKCVPFVSLPTLRRWLIQEGIMHKKATLRPFIEEDHAKARLRFGVRYLPHELDYWKRVLFTNESTIERADR